MTSREQIPGQIRFVDLHARGDRTIPLPKGWDFWDPGWNRDGSAVLASLYAFAAGVAEISLGGKTRVLIQDSPSGFFYSPRFSPDGRNLAYGKQGWNANVWLLESFSI